MHMRRRVENYICMCICLFFYLHLLLKLNSRNMCAVILGTPSLILIERATPGLDVAVLIISFFYYGNALEPYEP